uniref:Integrase catalytic domain-containing protein n=1 Tax=Lactuca sativa TaxID=4236 RepID=A0A9R1VWT5_LACSA|nr:hypothetical protein LSAT_V11C400213150 [Lactuca sativa]
MFQYICSSSFTPHGLVGPIPVRSLGGNKYTLVVVDEFTRFTWVVFLKKKSHAAQEIISLIRKNETLTELLSCPYDEVPHAEDEATISDSIVSVPSSLNQDTATRSSINSLGADETLEDEDSPATDNSSVSNSLESTSVSEHRYHPVDQIIGNIHDGVRTRSRVSNNFCMYVNFISMILPDMIHSALQDADWIKAMQEELNEFQRHKVWTLVPRP